MVKDLLKWLEANRYCVKKRPWWFKRSAMSREIIWPGQQAMKYVQRRPGMWQEDRIEWITMAEYMFKVLRGDKWV